MSTKQQMDSFFVGGFLALLMFGGATAGPLEDAKKAADRGDFAVEWKLLPRLANQGDAIAQDNLGLMYADGNGLPQDYAQAYAWFNLSASHAEDAETRDMAIKDRDLVATKMTTTETAKAQRMAQEWVPK
jgi:TPR repeat protein